MKKPHREGIEIISLKAGARWDTALGWGTSDPELAQRVHPSGSYNQEGKPCGHCKLFKAYKSSEASLCIKKSQSQKHFAAAMLLSPCSEHCHCPAVPWTPTVLGRLTTVRVRAESRGLWQGMFPRLGFANTAGSADDGGSSTLQSPTQHGQMPTVLRK